MGRTLRPTFTSTDEKIAIRSDSTKGQIHNRPGVTGACERSLPHSHFSKVNLGKKPEMTGRRRRRKLNYIAKDTEK